MILSNENMFLCCKKSLFLFHSVLKMDKLQIYLYITPLAQIVILRIKLFYPLVGLFEYLFMFWLEKHLPAKQALNSKIPPKCMEEYFQIWLL